MKKSAFLAITFFTLTVLFSSAARAQETDPPSRFELGAQFSSLTYSQATVQGFPATQRNNTSEAGFGGRFTLNLNRHVAV
jgi:hypothetical protein